MAETNTHRIVSSMHTILKASRFDMDEPYTATGSSAFLPGSCDPTHKLLLAPNISVPQMLQNLLAQAKHGSWNGIHGGYNIASKYGHVCLPEGGKLVGTETTNALLWEYHVIR